MPVCSDVGRKLVDENVDATIRLFQQPFRRTDDRTHAASVTADDDVSRRRAHTGGGVVRARGTQGQERSQAKQPVEVKRSPRDSVAFA